MLGLKVGDLDFNRKVIYIRRSIDSRTKQEQSTKTKNSTGEVPMPAALEKRLRAFLKTGFRENPNRYLFANRNGSPYSVRCRALDPSIELAFRRLNAAGLPVLSFESCSGGSARLIEKQKRARPVTGLRLTLAHDSQVECRCLPW